MAKKILFLLVPEGPGWGARPSFNKSLRGNGLRKPLPLMERGLKVYPITDTVSITENLRLQAEGIVSKEGVLATADEYCI